MKRSRIERSPHMHEHGFRWRSLLVGLMHGMAGSAALLVLAVSQAANPVYGLLYVLLFGIGSMLGMGALSTVIAVPLAVSARWLTWANRGLQGAVGVVTIGIGAMTIYSHVRGPVRASSSSFGSSCATNGLRMKAAAGASRRRAWGDRNSRIRR